MTDPILSADTVEKHDSLPRPEAAGEDLAVVGQDLIGDPMATHRLRQASQVGLAVALRTTSAETQNREWSSIPVTTFNSVPSVSGTPPITSICHNSIARPRSHRL
jgi:hypothetical protein